MKIFHLISLPVAGCDKMSDNKKTCLEHVFDKSQPKTWQLFDIEDFNEGWFHLNAYLSDVSKAFESSPKQ